MRSRWTVIPLVSFALFAAGCMRTLPPMPGVSVVTPSPAKAKALEEDNSKDEEEEESGADDSVEYVKPCKEGSMPLYAAELARDNLASKIESLPAAADPKPLQEELEKILEHPCFELAKVDLRETLEFTSAVSLRDWWKAGGSDWLWSYLHIEQRRSVRIPGTPRIALTREIARKDHPLMPLLCPADTSVPCATETAGWSYRTNEKLSLIAARYGGDKRDEVSCREEAEKQPKAERYAHYRDCVDTIPPNEFALPVGRFKAPTDGWFVIVDDGNSCHRARAYDLATGAAYDTLDCGPGSMTVTTGRLPVSALREAAWMFAIAGEAQSDVRRSRGFYVPDKMPIKRARGEGIGIGFIGCSCGSSEAHTWSWMREKNGVHRGQVSGHIFGNGGRNEALHHAFALLEIAEAAFDKGCAPAPPPARVSWGSPGPTIREDEERVVLDDLESEPARTALLKARAPRTCTPKP